MEEADFHGRLAHWPEGRDVHGAADRGGLPPVPLLPLDDCLYALQPIILALTRSSLHRCLQRRGISRLPQVEGEVLAKRKFKTYPIIIGREHQCRQRRIGGRGFRLEYQMSGRASRRPAVSNPGDAEERIWLRIGLEHPITAMRPRFSSVRMAAPADRRAPIGSCAIPAPQDASGWTLTTAGRMKVLTSNSKYNRTLMSPPATGNGKML